MTCPRRRRRRVVGNAINGDGCNDYGRTVGRRAKIRITSDRYTRRGSPSNATEDVAPSDRESVLAAKGAEKRHWATIFNPGTRRVRD